jgi:hypothetical protein
VITMRPQEKENPGAGGRTGAAGVYRQSCCYFSRLSAQYQALCRLIFLQNAMCPTFEPELSLRLDAALQALEAQEGRRGGPVHVGEVVREVMEDLARRQGARVGEGLCGE